MTAHSRAATPVSVPDFVNGIRRLGSSETTPAGLWQLRRSLASMALGLLASLMASGASAQVSFQATTTWSVGTSPWSVAVGDFNGDGKQDLAVANGTSNNVSVLTGDGFGGFAATVNFGVGTNPFSLAVGDFDGDGNQDLAVANYGSNNVSVLTGDGLGSFAAAVNFGVGTNPFSVAVGDFDGDGNQDLATANFSSNNVSVLAGDGSGGFAAVVNFSVGTNPISTAVGDFNGDGNQDLAVANYGSNNVSVLTGDGSGGFATAVNFGVGAGPYSVAVGDFNGDGNQDLAAANYGNNNVSVLTGDGSGGFAAAVNFGAGTQPRSVAVGDFNGDGKQDLATANQGSNNVSVLTGDGSGGFAAAVNFGVGAFPFSVAVGDFNGDGKQDLAVANANSNTVSILTGNGLGSFGAPVFGLGTSPYSVAVGDFNGDGKKDLATANTNTNNISVLTGDGSSGFSAAVNFGVGADPVSVAVGDFNGDGKQDLAVANFSSNNVSVLTGDGSGGFAAAVNFGVGTNPYSAVVGDFNGDGKQDLATANATSNNVSVLIGDGSGGFAAAVNFGAGSQSLSVAVGDFNGDGKQDLAVANFGSNNVSVLTGDGSGGFAAAVNFGVGTGPHSVAVGDFNGDGKKDLATANTNTNNVSVLTGDGSGGFAAAVNFGVGSQPRSVAVGDFNGDGKQDLAVANQSSNNVSILLGDGLGGFAAAVNFGVGTTPFSVAVGDFNGDGKQDLAVANQDSNNVSVLRNTTPFVPGAPTIGAATAGNGTVSVAFTAPVSNGGSPITGYTATCSGTGGPFTNTGTTPSISVTVPNGTAVTCTVHATNVVGNSAESSPSNSVTPVVPGQTIQITGQAPDGPEGNVGPNTTRTWVLTKVGTGATVVPFTLSGLASYTEDYTISGSGVNVGGGTISFASGTVTRTITVSVKFDTKYEQFANETIVLTLGTPTNGFSIFGSNNATTTITQSQDTQPNVKLAWSNVAEAAGTALVTVTLSNKSYQTVSVDAFTTNGPTASPAVAPGDYTAVAYLASTFNALQIPADALTATFTVSISQDSVDENNETFTVSLANPANATPGSPFTLAHNILDDDAPPTVSISPASLSVAEGNSGTQLVMFTATLSVASGRTVVVNTSTTAGTAASPGDYALLTIPSGVTFLPGETTKTFSVSVKGDGVLEADETLSVNVAPTNGTTTPGVPTTATLTIQNDDSPALSIDDPVLVEGASGTTDMMFTVSITSPAPTGGVGFTYTTSDVTATDGSDYTGTTGTTVTGLSGGILAGNLTATILIPINGDLAVEGHETFKVTLSAATGNSATILDNEGVGTIENDDVPAPGDLVISEFRLNGPGGAQDEFVEIANTTAAPIKIGEPGDTSVTGGFSVASDGGVKVFTIPNGTTIPARGHYLGANSVGYSLLNFGGAGAANHDASWTPDVGDDTGLALFATSDTGAYGTATPLDAVGFTSSSAQYREGAGLAGIGAGPFTKNHAFVRKHIYGGGSLENTPDNAADFALVAVDPATYGGPSTAVLGGASPENLAAETERTNAEFTLGLLDPASDQFAGDNYHFTAAVGGANSKFIELRRRVVNLSLTQSYSAVRLKTTSLSTVNNDPGPGSTQADFRPTSSSLCNGSTVPGPLGFGPCTTGVANALTLEQPPAYFTLGITDATGVMGGLNSTLRLGAVPLLANTSVGVNFKLFYTTSGLPGFFWVTVEAKP